MQNQDLQDALSLFEIDSLPSQEDLQTRYHKLLHTWHPARYASLTNNPRKYMEMYKKGEAKTKEIHSAYQALLAGIKKDEGPDS